MMTFLLAGWSLAAGSVEAKPSRLADPPRYDLKVTLDLDSATIHVRGSLRLAAADTAREFIPILLSDAMTDLRADVVAPQTSAGPISLQKVAAGSKGVLWLARPSRPFLAGRPVEIRFSYRGAAADRFVYHLGNESCFADGRNAAWYPMTEMGGWIGGVGRLTFQASQGYLVAATGESPSEIDGLASLRHMAGGRFQFEVSKPTIFGFAAAKYTLSMRSGSPTVSAYLSRPRDEMPRTLDRCREVLRFLGQEFGPYPYRSLRIVEVPTEHAKGFTSVSLAGMLLVPTKVLDEPFDPSLIAHELGHQWWGRYVDVEGSEGASLLTEGLAQYGSLLAAKQFLGTEGAARIRKEGWRQHGASLNTCLGYSVPVTGLRGYLLMSASGVDQPLDSLSGSFAHSLAVSKGALAFDLLAQTMGRDRMRSGLKQHVRQNAYREVPWRSFVSTMEAQAGSDLSRFIPEWFARTGVPAWTVTWKQSGDRLVGEVVQLPPYYHVRADLAVGVRVQGWANRKAIRRTLALSGPRTPFELVVRDSVVSVTLDPDLNVPHWTPELLAEAAPIRICASAETRDDYQRAVDQLRAALDRSPGPLERFYLELGLARMFDALSRPGDAREHLQAALSLPRVPDGMAAWAHFYLGKAERDLGDPVSARRNVEAALRLGRGTQESLGLEAEANRLLAELP